VDGVVCWKGLATATRFISDIEDVSVAHRMACRLCTSARSLLLQGCRVRASGLVVSDRKLASRNVPCVYRCAIPFTQLSLDAMCWRSLSLNGVTRLVAMATQLHFAHMYWGVWCIPNALLLLDYLVQPYCGFAISTVVCSLTSTLSAGMSFCAGTGIARSGRVCFRQK
jgi:hypothetical protein